MATVADIFALALPSGTELAAGREGLFREVTWVATLRPVSPGFDPLKGGELVLISMRAAALLDERLTLRRMVDSLSAMGVAAIAVLGEVPPEARQVADERRVPLFSLPPGSDLLGIERQATKVIVDHRTRLYQQVQHIHHELTELAIQGAGVSAIGQKLAELTGKAVAVTDENLALRLFLSPVESRTGEEMAFLLQGKGQAVRAWLARQNLAAANPPVTRLELGPHSCLLAPIVARDGVAGYIGLLAADGEPAEVDGLALGHAAGACAIEMARERAVIQTRDRLLLNFWEDLLHAGPGSEMDIIDRAKRLGYDLTTPNAVLVLRPQQESSRPMGLQALMEALAEEMRPRGAGLFPQERDGSMIVLHPMSAETTPQSLKDLGKTLAGKLASQGGGPVASVGVGRLHPGVGGIRRAYQEAQQALTLGERLFGRGHIAYFGELGVYRLLFGLLGTAELEAFYQETLGALEEYDRRRGGDLIPTLEAYFNCQGSTSKAARVLYVHRNTLFYRLKRIQEILGQDLEDPQTRLSLALALRVREVLQTTSHS